MLETLLEAAEYLYDSVGKGITEETIRIAEDMENCLMDIMYASKDFKKEDKRIGTDDACRCIIYSIKNIMRNPEKWRERIVYELISFIKNTHENLLLYGLLGEKEAIKEFIDSGMFEENYRDQELMQAIQKDKYKYDLSIVLFAYNKLEYTKLCLKSLLENLPKNLKYELVLINHGSSDETKEFFESLEPDKQIDILINRSIVGTHLHLEGKYVLNISNDILVTEKAVENMLRIMEEDSSVAKVVPATTAISNLQTIETDFANFKEMYAFASKNNIYDIRRQERRTRLCDPIALLAAADTEIAEFAKFSILNNFDGDKFLFPDDLQSLYFRRRGRKLVLAKDAFCYHFGSVTIKDEKTMQDRQAYYNRGREYFFEKFGIDPWGTGCCWEPDLFSILPCDKNEKTNILGINCGIGSNSLKVKENLKELQHNLDVELINITDDSRYEPDLKGISDSSRIVSSEAELMEICYEKSFDYVVWEDEFKDDICSEEFTEKLIQSVKPDGYIAIKDVNRKYIDILAKKFKYEKAGQWYVFCS